MARHLIERRTKNSFFTVAQRNALLALLLLFALGYGASAQSIWLRVDGMNQGINANSHFRALAGFSAFAVGKEFGDSTSGWLVGISTIANASSTDRLSVYVDLLYDTGVKMWDFGLGGVTYFGPIGLAASGHVYLDSSKLDGATSGEDAASLGFSAGIVLSLDRSLAQIPKRQVKNNDENNTPTIESVSETGEASESVENDSGDEQEPAEDEDAPPGRE